MINDNLIFNFKNLIFLMTLIFFKIYCKSKLLLQ